MNMAAYSLGQLGDMVVGIAPATTPSLDTAGAPCTGPVSTDASGNSLYQCGTPGTGSFTELSCPPTSYALTNPDGSFVCSAPVAGAASVTSSAAVPVTDTTSNLYLYLALAAAAYFIFARGH